MVMSRNSIVAILEEKNMLKNNIIFSHHNQSNYVKYKLIRIIGYSPVFQLGLTQPRRRQCLCCGHSESTFGLLPPCVMGLGNRAVPCIMVYYKFN